MTSDGGGSSNTINNSMIGTSNCIIVYGIKRLLKFTAMVITLIAEGPNGRTL